MTRIYNGLKSRVDVSLYAAPEFDSNQMKQIRLGLESGIDVSEYLDSTLYAEDMEYMRKYEELRQGSMIQ